MEKWQIEHAKDYIALAKREVASLNASFERFMEILNEEDPDLDGLNFWCNNTKCWLSLLKDNLKKAQKELNEF